MFYVHCFKFTVIQLLNCYIVSLFHCSLFFTKYEFYEYTNLQCISIYFELFLSISLFFVYCSLRNTNFTNVRIYNVFLFISSYFIVLRSLFTAHCPLLLPTAHCQLPTASCPLPPANCLLPTASCQLPPANCLLPTASCQLPTAYGFIFHLLCDQSQSSGLFIITFSSFCI